MSTQLSTQSTKVLDFYLIEWLIGENSLKIIFTACLLISTIVISTVVRIKSDICDTVAKEGYIFISASYTPVFHFICLWYIWNIKWKTAEDEAAVAVCAMHTVHQGWSWIISAALALLMLRAVGEPFYISKGPKDSIGYKITRLHFTYIDDAQSGRRAFSSLEAKQTRPKFLALI